MFTLGLQPSAMQVLVEKIISALVTIATNMYTDFGTIAGAALDMIAAQRGVILSRDNRAKQIIRVETN